MDKFELNNEKILFIMGAGASIEDYIPPQKDLLKHIVKGKFYSTNALNDKFLKISKDVKTIIETWFPGSTNENLPSLESVFNILETAIERKESVGNIAIAGVDAYYVSLINGLMDIVKIAGPSLQHDVRSNLSSSPYQALCKKFYDNPQKYKTDKISFVTFNYDICIDRVILSMYLDDKDKTFDLDYGIELGNYELNGSDFSFKRPRERRLLLLRPHGAINWLWCSACNRIFSKLKHQISNTDILQNGPCYSCGNKYLKPFIVHPSYDHNYTNAFSSQIWWRLEQELQESDIWCFIGYSLPDADRFLQYLLVRTMQLRRTQKRKTSIIFVGWKGASEEDNENYMTTVKRYKLLFGEHIIFYDKGFLDFARNVLE